MQEAIEKYMDYAKKSAESNLFEQGQKFSLQIVLNKIPNLKNQKRVLW